LTRFTETGEVRAGRVRPCNRHALKRVSRKLRRVPLVAAVEAMTGWRFVVEELERVGAEVHLAEPAEVSTRRDTKRRAKTDRLDARLLRELLTERRLPEARIPPSHLLDLRAQVRLRRWSISTPSGCSASTPSSFTTASRSRPAVWAPGGRTLGRAARRAQTA
jgi:hypothetical protein